MLPFKYRQYLSNLHHKLFTMCQCFSKARQSSGNESSHIEESSMLYLWAYKVRAGFTTWYDRQCLDATKQHFTQRHSAFFGTLFPNNKRGEAGRVHISSKMRRLLLNKRWVVSSKTIFTRVLMVWCLQQGYVWRETRAKYIRSES